VQQTRTTNSYIMKMCTTDVKSLEYYVELVGTHDLRPLEVSRFSLNRKGLSTKVKTKNISH
jgi:hypothetical protein